MATDEKVEAWLSSVERILAAAGALKASIKVYEQGGPTIEEAFATVEAARVTLRKANKLEDAMFGKLTEASPQTTMPGVRPVKPHERKALPGPRALPPATGSATES